MTDNLPNGFGWVTLAAAPAALAARAGLATTATTAEAPTITRVTTAGKWGFCPNSRITISSAIISSLNCPAHNCLQYLSLSHQGLKTRTISYLSSLIIFPFYLLFTWTIIYLKFWGFPMLLLIFTLRIPVDPGKNPCPGKLSSCPTESLSQVP